MAAPRKYPDELRERAKRLVAGPGEGYRAVVELGSEPQRKSYADTGLKAAHPVPHIAGWPAEQKVLTQSVEANSFQGVPLDKALNDGSANIDAALAG